VFWVSIRTSLRLPLETEVQDMEMSQDSQTNLDRGCGALTSDEFCGARERSVVKQAVE